MACFTTDNPQITFFRMRYIREWMLDEIDKAARDGKLKLLKKLINQGKNHHFLQLNLQLEKDICT